MRVNTQSQTQRPHRGRDEAGQTLPIVMAVVLVVVLLSVALFTRVNGDFNNTNLETKIEQARSLAQSGIADALFRIDQQGSSPASFCNEPNSGGQCALSSIPNAAGTVYTARYNASSGAYTVLSQGTVRNISYAVQTTVKQTPILVNAVYGGAFVTFDGRSNTAVTVTDAYGKAIAGATAGIAVGPGGSLTCNGPADPNATYVNYGGSISKCTPYQNLGPIYAPQQPTQTCPPPPNPYGAPPTPCLPSTASACTTMSPAVTGSDATGYTVKGPATLEPGVYVCRGGLTMTGTVNVDYAQSPQQNSGRVEIFVFPAVGSSTSPDINFGGATVNACEPPLGSGSGTCKGGLVGDPTDLEIYGSGSGNAGLGASQVNAVFWGPGMNLTLNGSSSALTWTGGLILGGITANGHPSFALNFDQRLQSEFQQSSWSISNYLETTPGFSIP
jgi:Tfp pilus assembly protein PilX